MGIALVQKVKAKAEEIELKSVDFLDSNGALGARWNEVHSVRLTFIDDEFFVLLKEEFEQFVDVEFKLRPTLIN